MIKPVDNEGMMQLALIIFLVVIGPLAVLRGADSRVTDTRDSQRWSIIPTDRHKR
jgi:hypothetical protein